MCNNQQGYYQAMDNHINAEEYKRLYLGEFKVDKRYNQLVDRLTQYYQDTPDTMGNKEAIVHWKLFKQWTDAHGFTNDEINRAKRDGRVQCQN